MVTLVGTVEETSGICDGIKVDSDSDGCKYVFVVPLDFFFCFSFSISIAREAAALTAVLSAFISGSNSERKKIIIKIKK
jgi:hypothetical protein